MPKAKFKRKGVPPEFMAAAGGESEVKRLRTTRSESVLSPLVDTVANVCTTEISPSVIAGKIAIQSACSLLHLPEEVVCLIVALLEYDVAALAALEASCRRMRQVIVDARLWRRLLVARLEQEPGLRGFLSPSWVEANSMREEEEDRREATTAEEDHLRYVTVDGTNTDHSS